MNVRHPLNEAYTGSALRMPTALHDRLREISFETRISINTLMVALMEMGLEVVDGFKPEALTAQQRGEFLAVDEKAVGARTKLIQRRMVALQVKKNGMKQHA